MGKQIQFLSLAAPLFALCEQTFAQKPLFASDPPEPGFRPWCDGPARMTMARKEILFQSENLYRARLTCGHRLNRWPLFTGIASHRRPFERIKCQT
jgi:hypothetical protein